MNLSTPRHQV